MRYVNEAVVERNPNAEPQHAWILEEAISIKNAGTGQNCQSLKLAVNRV